jgi:hypothetical protein
LIRGDLDRCLIVAPGSLVEQWQEAHRPGDLIRTQLLPQSQARDRRFDLVARDDVEAEANFSDISAVTVRCCGYGLSRVAAGPFPIRDGFR